MSLSELTTELIILHTRMWLYTHGGGSDAHLARKIA